MNLSPTKKRENYLKWNDYFMAMAFLAAKRSKDPSTQVGACIVNKDKKIIGLGYNGFPTNCSDDEFPWGKNTENPIQSKYLYVVHAEVNAVLNKMASDVKNCTLFVALFPCNECAKVIIQSGIKEIFYLSDKHAHKPEVIASKRMLDAAGIKCIQYKPTCQRLIIDFTDIDNGAFNQLPPTPVKKE